MVRKTAEEEFNTSSDFKPPPGEAWKIRNDYPRSSDKPPPEDKPWLRVDFKTEPEKYCNILKEYFFRGNTENNFVLQKNKVRDWYHPPWLHYGPRGREPINGLTFGGYLDPGYLAKDQSKPIQGWLCSYFNWEAATILGDMWADPKRIPKWDTHLNFPAGSVICENIFCDNTDGVPIAEGSPAVKAAIGELPPDWKPGDERFPVRSHDKPLVKTLHLVQVDFAARDERSPIGWVFGTYACDGRKEGDPWSKVFPIGLQWGNDPDLLQKQYDAGKRPTQLWKNPDALALVEELGGQRPWLGWHERLDGLADDFMGTCTSCHATAQLYPPTRDRTPMVQDPKPQYNKKEERWVQEYEEVERIWLRNLPRGRAFDEDSLSADYNMHVEFGYTNYREWSANGEK
ncbi:hypothetical protein OG21DRAFT_1485507 [Imleria badia]|nr:hypothetical protein OG21DRAFT_1485507 [Imleria badia]